MSINKNKGQLLTSIYNGTLDLLPLRWRARLGYTKTDQEVPVDVPPDGMNGDSEEACAMGLISSQVVQTRTDERLKTNITLTSGWQDKQIVEYYLTKEGQIATRVVTIVPAGEPLPPTDELTVEAEQQNLGPCFSEQTISTVPNLFGANDYVVEIRDVVPTEFAALLKTYETAVTVAGVAAMPTLGVGELRREEQQLTVETKRVSVRYRDLVDLPVIIVDHETNREKQDVTVKRTLQLISVAPLEPTPVKDTKYDNLGNGMAVQTESYTDAIFVGAVYAKSKLNLIPERFRASIPTRRHSFSVQNSLVNVDPPLATGDLSRTETQTDEFNKRVDIEYIDPLGALPIILVTLDTNKEKQVVTIQDELRQDTYTPPAPSPVRDVKVVNLGNGYIIVTLTTVDAIFVGAVYGKSKLNLIPERFRAAIPTRKHDFTMQNSAVDPDPTLATGQFSRTETQIDEFNKRVEIEYIDPLGALPIVLENKDTNKEKQVVTVRDELRADTYVSPEPSPVQDVKVTDLNNGYIIVTLTSVDAVFVGAVYGKSKMNLIPERFRAAIPTRKHDFTVQNSAVDPDPTLATGQFSRTETQIDEFNKRVEIEYIDPLGVLPIVLENKDTNKEKQVVTIRDELRADTYVPPVPSPVQDVKVTDLNNGYIIVTLTSVDAVFVGASYGKSILNLIPEKLRAAVPQKKHDYTVQNSAVVPDPVLATGELSHVETQIDEFNKRVESTSIDTVAGVSVADKVVVTEFGGAIATRTATLATHGTVSVETGLRVLKSELTDLNNGWDVLETFKSDDTSWPSLNGQDYDERFDVLIPYTMQVKTADADLGVPRTEVKPIDKWREESRTVDIAAVADFLDTYSLSYFGKVNIDLPDKLISLTSVIVTDRGEGASDETGTFAFTGSYSVSQALRATAQSSSTMIPEVTATIKQFWGNNIACTNYHFFLPSPVTPADVTAKITELVGEAVADWPKYNPEIVSLVISGGRTSVQATASSQGSSAASTSGTSSTSGGGTGYSREQGLTVKSMRISPTIHAAMSVGGTMTDSDTVNVSATAEATGLGPSETETQSSSVSASVTPTSIPATAGATDWPTTGKFLLRVDAQPYRFGYIQIHAVVVDAADFPSS
jgi:hypothetical protein